MARGNLKGPVGPLMLAMLFGIAIFMLFVVQSPELTEKFKRPEGFYENTFEKVGVALLFAAFIFIVVAVFRKLRK